MVERKCARVYFRVFPTEGLNWEDVKILDDYKTIYVRCLQDFSKGKGHLRPSFWTFNTDRVFYNTSQKEIYTTVVENMFESIQRQRDCIIMSYGQTGSGKSVTLNGLHNCFEDRGILPRLIVDTFETLKSKTSTKPHMKVCVQVSYVEFSKTSITDLLKQHPNSVCSLKNISKVKVKNEEETLKLIFQGEGRKDFAKNASYLSHICSSIFTIFVKIKDANLQDNTLKIFKMHVIDFAGADTVGNSSCVFKNPDEIGSGNLSKSYLEQFFLALLSNISDQIKIKYRLSPMIQYLGDSLNKNSIFRLIGHIRISRDNLLVIKSMLRFAQLIGGLKATKSEMPVIVEKNVEREKLISQSPENETNFIKENFGSNISSYQDFEKSLNKDRHEHIQRTVNEYLQNKIPELALINVCEISTALEILKMTCQQAKFNESLRPNSERKVSHNSINKFQAKSSQNSNRTSLTDILVRKNSEQKLLTSSSRSKSANIGLKASEKRALSSREMGSNPKPKTSSSSLLKQSSTGRKNSNSSASVRGAKSKSEEFVLIPNLPPSFTDAWAIYTKENHQEYSELVNLYEIHKNGAKEAYKTYLKELDGLKDLKEQTDEKHNNILLARITQKLMEVTAPPEEIQNFQNEFEKCASQEVQNFEEKLDKAHETVLQTQSTLKAYINGCEKIKINLQESFDKFCEEKYHISVPNLHASSIVANIDEVLQVEQNEICNFDEVQNDNNHDAETFEKYKVLIEVERRKKIKYKLKHQEWATY